MAKRIISKKYRNLGTVGLVTAFILVPMMAFGVTSVVSAPQHTPTSGVSSKTVFPQTSPTKSISFKTSHKTKTVPSTTVRTAVKKHKKHKKKGFRETNLLNLLPVKTENNTGYDRSKFYLWATTNGCTARNHVLISESLIPVTKNSYCTVTAGKWVSHYDGVVTTVPRVFDIDHMVPLAEAWGSGASSWTSDRRKAYANDLGYAGTLIAVSASSNRSKSDRDVAEWLPPNKSYRCVYTKTWLSVKYRWGLSIDSRERGALKTLINSCGNPKVSKPDKT